MCSCGADNNHSLSKAGYCDGITKYKQNYVPPKKKKKKG